MLTKNDMGARFYMMFVQGGKRDVVEHFYISESTGLCGDITIDGARGQFHMHWHLQNKMRQIVSDRLDHYGR